MRNEQDMRYKVYLLFFKRKIKSESNNFKSKTSKYLSLQVLGRRKLFFYCDRTIKL